MSSVHLEITGGLGGLDGALRTLAEQAVAAAALKIEAAAKEGAAVRTGALRESISAVTAQESHYDENVAKAADLNPEATFAPEVEIAGPLDAAVQVPVNYAGFLEYGTSRQSAKAFLTPALEAVLPELEADLAELGGEGLAQSAWQEWQPRGGPTGGPA